MIGSAMIGSASIGYGEALALLRDAAPAPVVERCPVATARERILAADCHAGEALPPFDNAAMDGFALRLDGQSRPAGTAFAVDGAQAAGDAACVATGEAMEIMTGARLPGGLDSVIAVERVRIDAHDAAGRAHRIVVEEAVQPGTHIRRRGEDLAQGSRMLAAGTLVGIEEQTLLVATGALDVDVARRPRIGLIATGFELVDDPTTPLGSGQIRNSNTPMLTARAAQAGAEPVHAETVGDRTEDFLAALDRALERDADIVCSSGAVSMGRHDFVPQALRALGADILFHKCRIRPGKPILFARLPEGQLYFGLPGNPASAAVGFRFFVEPVLRRMLGLAPERPTRLRLTAPVKAKPPLQVFLKGRLRLDADDRVGVEALHGQESFRIRPLLETRAWIVLPEDRDAFEAGSAVEVFSTGHLLPLPLPTTTP